MKTVMKDRARLVIVLALIIGAIAYLSFMKPHNTGTSSAVPVAIPSAAPARQGDIAAKALQYTRASELQHPSGFINTNPFTISDIIGKKVILVDFWTYSCINCQRTTPYLKAWYEKYKEDGLEIIGVHTPEFQFEHETANVQSAVKKFGITYPVVQDNDYGTWNAYHNLYWPHKYLIDIDGFIVYDHIGEGGYEETEQAIQQALQERADVLGTKASIATDMAQPADAIAFDQTQIASPEVYFGAARNELLGNGRSGQEGAQQFSIPSSKKLNTLYLDGSWNITNEFAETQAQNTGVVFHYKAKNMYMVAASAQGADISVVQDGKPIRVVHVKENQLYTLIENPTYGEHTVELRISTPGLQAFTFTFG